MLVKNKGSQPVSITLPVNPGQSVQQVMQAVCNADVNKSLNARGFLLNEVNGPGAYIWFNVGGAGFDPGPMGARTSVPVAFAANSTAATIATAINTAIGANAALAGRFSSSVQSSVNVVVTNTVGGIVGNGTNVNGIDLGSQFAFSILTLGSNSVNVTFSPGQILQFSDALAFNIQLACINNSNLEILLTGPVINCSFIVDHANGNGVGVRTLKTSPGIANVHGFSSVPIAGNNVPSGFFQVLLNQQFSQYFGGFAGPVAPLTGSNVNAGSFVSGTVYVIVVVGNTNWQAIGLPSNITAAVGVAFIATGVGSGTGVVQKPSVSGIGSVEVVGDPNQTINAVGGGYILLQYIAPTINTGAYVTPMIPSQPNDNTVIGATFYLG